MVICIWWYYIWQLYRFHYLPSNFQKQKIRWSRTKNNNFSTVLVYYVYWYRILEHRLLTIPLDSNAGFVWKTPRFSLSRRIWNSEYTNLNLFYRFWLNYLNLIKITFIMVNFIFWRGIIDIQFLKCWRIMDHSNGVFKDLI